MKKTVNQIASALEMELGRGADDVPPGFRTVKEWAAIWGLDSKQADSTCRRHCRSGRMASKTFKIMVANVLRRIEHYMAVK